MPELALPQLHRLAQLSALCLNHTQVGAGINQIRIQNQRTPVQLAGLAGLAVPLFYVTQRTQNLWVVGEL